MQRKKISPYIFLGIALLLLSAIYLIEHSGKAIYDQANHPRGYLVLDLISKGCLSMLTGSIFFLVTEWFRDRKAKDKAADVQREFLTEVRFEFNSWIHGFKTETVPGDLTPDKDYFGESFPQEIVDHIRNWREIKTLTMEQTQEAAFYWIESFREFVVDHESLANHYRSSFSIEFNRKLDEAMREFNRAQSFRMKFNLPMLDKVESAMLSLIAFRAEMIELENIYRKEHKLDPIVKPSTNRSLVLTWPEFDPEPRS